VTEQGNGIRLTDSLIWRKDLYPRFKPDPATIDRYAESIETLPAIEINQHDEIIDGYHRWTAYKEAKAETIAVTVTQTESDAHLLRLAIQRNAAHGLQLSTEEKRHFVLQLYSGKVSEKAELAQLFSVSERTIARWTARRDKDLKDFRDKQIADLWLACYTEEEIAEAVGIPVGTLKGTEWFKMDTWQKSTIFSAYQEPDWTPPIYNVWKCQTKSNSTQYFGNSESSFTDNLLYMYTEPFDIVVDPFGGGGSTIDVCQKRLRRYWVSDRKPSIKRTDMRQHDILDGPPPLHKRWADVALVFLAPPYWKQAEAEYSDDPQDLANMPLDRYYATLSSLVKECASRMRAPARIALMIQPTQWKNEDKAITDHIADLLAIVSLPLELRISCPYESQQANAQMVNWAKENRRVLVLTREIIVWQVL